MGLSASHRDELYRLEEGSSQQPLEAPSLFIGVGCGLCGHVTHRPSNTANWTAPVSLSGEVTRSRNRFHSGSLNAC